MELLFVTSVFVFVIFVWLFVVVSVVFVDPEPVLVFVALGSPVVVGDVDVSVAAGVVVALESVGDVVSVIDGEVVSGGGSVTVAGESVGEVVAEISVVGSVSAFATNPPKYGERDATQKTKITKLCKNNFVIFFRYLVE